jgi:hypothetical protein
VSANEWLDEMQKGAGMKLVSEYERHLHADEVVALREIAKYPMGIKENDLWAHGLGRGTCEALKRLRLLDYGRQGTSWSRAYSITDKGRQEITHEEGR